MTKAEVRHGRYFARVGTGEEIGRFARGSDRPLALLLGTEGEGLSGGAHTVRVEKPGYLPYEQRIFAAVHEMGALARLHICGDITPRLPMLKQTGMSCFNFDWAITPEQMVRTALLS